MTRGNDLTTGVLVAARELPVQSVQLITFGVVLAVVGLAMVWASGVWGRRRRKLRTTASSPARRRCPLSCTAVACGVITGLQWAVLSRTDPTAVWMVVWLVVLGLPAFLAGATVARLLKIIRLGYRRRHQARSVARSVGRGWMNADD